MALQLNRQATVFIINMRDRAWFARRYGDNPRALASGLSTVQADEPCSISLEV